MEVKNEQINGMVYWWSIGSDYWDCFIMTNNYHTLIAPVILFLYGVYRLVFVK